MENRFDPASTRRRGVIYVLEVVVFAGNQPEPIFDFAASKMASKHLSIHKQKVWHSPANPTAKVAASR